MHRKLNNSCVQFDALGIHLLGNPKTGDLFGLTEEGFRLVQKLIDGCDIDPKALTESENELFIALEKCQLFNDEIQPSHRSAYLHVTSRCNVNCPGCYSELDRSKAATDILNLNDLKRIVDNLVHAGVDSVTISGGEPFLRKDIIDLIKYMKLEKKIPWVSCITNGKADLSTYAEAIQYLNKLSFSLDGYSAESSCFRKATHDKVTKLINCLSHSRHNISIIFTVHKKNYRHCADMRILAESLSVQYNFSMFATPHSEQTSEYEITNEDIPIWAKYLDAENIEISDTPLEHSIGCKECCGAGNNIISIASNGDILPCHMFFDRHFLMGNALVDDLKSILDKRNKPLISVMDKEECPKCEFRYICGGGCPFRSYIARCRLEDLDPLCPLYVSEIRNTLSALIG